MTSGTGVTLTAPTLSGKTFTGWSGSCSGGSCSLTMTSNKTVTANYIITTYTLNVGVNPSGGGTVTAPGINCPGDCSESYNSGRWVNPIATPATGYEFISWIGACVNQINSCWIQMTGSKNTTANFVLSQRSPTAHLEVKGGTDTTWAISVTLNIHDIISYRCSSTNSTTNSSTYS